ncbi:MAG: hypothetical protein B6244_05870 [Candidatus Cloacimonetes bacterium 4572_55]|nr:MAG: hypothetical protein B6244_05870 [Candidatus Cloacimonetes bacterium 4572_55]
MLNMYQIHITRNEVRFFLNGHISDNEANKFLQEFKRNVLSKVSSQKGWFLLIDFKNLKSLRPFLKEVISDILALSKAQNVTAVIHFLHKVTLSVQIKRLAKEVGILNKIYTVTNEQEAQKILDNYRPIMKKKTLKPKKRIEPIKPIKKPVEKKPTFSRRPPPTSYQIMPIKNGIFITFMGQMSVLEAKRFVRDFRASMPISRKWYVVADSRRVKVQSQKVSKILQEATDLAKESGRRFSVQIVKSATARLQLHRVAREKGQEDLFFVVNNEQDAEKIVQEQKAKFGIR